jgi:hypothetical protein
VTALDDFHSMHPASPRPDALPVNWSAPEPQAARIRVRDYTCECRSVVFEQCRAGGLAFVRRHDRSVFPWVITESPWGSISDTELLWRQLMAGKAR